MSDVQNLTVEILKQIRSDLKEGLYGVRQRLDFFAEELIRMRTRDNERLSSLESAVAELQRKVGQS